MISVVIPLGPNRERNLELTLHGLHNQTFQDFEICVCGSPPQRDIWGWDNRTRFWLAVSERPNLGAVNRNKGASRARYDWLVFIDSDIVLAPNALELYAENFGKYDHRAIAGLYHWLPPILVTQEDLDERWADFISGRLPPDPQFEGVKHNIGRDGREANFNLTDADHLYSNYAKCLMLLSGNLGVHREVFNYVGGFCEDLSRGIDGAFGLELHRKGVVFSFDSRIVGYHLFHERYKPAFESDPFPYIRKRWHSDDSWIGTMDRSYGWPLTKERWSH